MLKQGVVRGFPWLAYTVLPQIYTDHHFLYHILLIPFIWKLPALAGVKVATVFINTALMLTFYFFMKINGIRRPLFFVFLILSAAPFIFRIDLAKANGLSSIFIMLILFAIFRKKYFFLALLSFFYVWSYGGWPLSIFLAGIYFMASIFANVIMGDIPSFGKGGLGRIHKLLNPPQPPFSEGGGLAPLLATIIGSAAGLVINPYFPQNLKFYWIQTVQIALVNYQTKIGVGAEWYGFNLAELVSYSGPVILVFIFALLFFFGAIFTKKKVASREAIRDILFFAICAGAFFVLTLKSRRNTEYLYPFAILLSAFILKYFYDRELLCRLKKQFLCVLKKEFFLYFLIAYLAIMFAASFGLNFWRIKSALSQGFDFDCYKEAMNVIKYSTAPGDIIFHSDWDDWPMLFYHNDYNRYVVGLDTTFMYKYNKDLYKKWRDITWGDYQGDAYPIIKGDFRAAIIFIAKNDIDMMDKYFKDDARYELLYDKEGKVYKIL